MKPRLQMSLRTTLLLVVGLALLCSFVIPFLPEPQPRAPTKPMAWAQSMRSNYGVGDIWDEYESDMSYRYRRLEAVFDKLDVKFEESTSFGPFTDILRSGELVESQFEILGFQPYKETLGLGEQTPWRLPIGTSCVVEQDPAKGLEDCRDTRYIEVKILKGPLAGRRCHLERVYLRRRP